MCLPDGKIGRVQPIPSNTTIFSPRGFLPHVKDPRAVVDVAGGSVWGADDVARLRTAGLVRVRPAEDEGQVVDGGQIIHGGQTAEGHGVVVANGARAAGSALDADDLVLRTLLWLALAGVPVTGDGLATSVRERLDPGLLDLLDRVEPATVADPGGRELLSLALRRRARELAGHPPAEEQPAVAVLLADGELPATLAADLEAQTWGAVVRCPTPREDAAEVLGGARARGALYCTRMSADLRYGPHHLADLVEALRHSGARVAHSPLRFRPWHAGTWLEDDAGVEGPASGGLPDASLWYAVDGPRVPDAQGDGYAVHGGGAVPVSEVTGGPAVALRLHRDTPVVLDWLPESLGRAAAGTSTTPARPGGGGEDADPVPRSYFAAAGTPSRARSSSTASDS